MSKPDLHIVSFDVPYPPDYGGAVDVYWKLAALREKGVKVALHAFTYGEKEVETAVLNDLVATHYLYPRPRNLYKQFTIDPFIVKTRMDAQLLSRLEASSAPILFEGIHTTGFLGHPNLGTRKQGVRIHNFEADYYKDLAKVTPISRYGIYLQLESWRLRRYEPTLWAKADRLFPISTADAAFLPKEKTSWLPAFYDEQNFSAPPPREKQGDYYLFHGNLGIVDNAQAASFLIQTLSGINNVRLIVAGKNPPAWLSARAAKSENASIYPNPDDATLKSLLFNCKAHILWTFQQAGVKLKLLHALKSGRPVICSPMMVAGSGLEQAVFQVQNAESLIKLVIDFSPPIALNNGTWEQIYSNSRNAGLITTWMESPVLVAQ